MLPESYGFEFVDGLPDAAEHGRTSDRFESAEQRRSGLAAAYRDPNGLEHLPGLDTERFGRRAESRFEPVVGELRGCEGGAGLLQDSKRECRVAFLRDQLLRVVRRQF